MPGARHVAIVLGTLIAAMATFTPQAARSQTGARSFERVKVTPPPAPNDPSFAAFRQNLASVARGRVFDELARNVVPQGFFWDRDFADGFDPKKSGAENLAAAIRLEQGSGIGWERLADFAAEPTATEIPAAPGVLCAPGRPAFDQDDFDRLVEATRSSATDWVFPRAEGLELHASPRSASAIVEKLGGYFVRVIHFDTTPANAEPLHTSWARIVAPSGKIGYAAPNTLASLSAPQLCYLKDITSRWHITGFVGVGN
jgi:hypothetical protein